MVNSSSVVGFGLSSRRRENSSTISGCVSSVRRARRLLATRASRSVLSLRCTRLRTCERRRGGGAAAQARPSAPARGCALRIAFALQARAGAACGRDSVRARRGRDGARRGPARGHACSRRAMRAGDVVEQAERRSRDRDRRRARPRRCDARRRLRATRTQQATQAGISVRRRRACGVRGTPSCLRACRRSRTSGRIARFRIPGLPRCRIRRRR